MRCVRTCTLTLGLVLLSTVGCLPDDERSLWDTLMEMAAERGYAYGDFIVAAERAGYDLPVSAYDCNGNNRPDGLDILEGRSSDCDRNGVPDECELDSDGDGVIDACDDCPNDPLKTEPGACGCRTSDADEDGNGVPDCLDGVGGCSVARFTTDGAAGQDFAGCFTVVGRVGNAASLTGRTYELGAGPAEGQPTETADYSWCNGHDITFALVRSGNAVQFTVGGRTLATELACPTVNALLFRVRANKGACTLHDVQVNGLPYGEIAAESDHGNTLALMRLACEFDGDFTVTGSVRMTWRVLQPPHSSQLGFEITAGQYGDDTPPLTDCNGNGVDDAEDLAAGTSVDCNANGVPDECEADADGDGVIDACDGCPNDPLKAEPGDCGCGVVDEDRDGDGTPDCADGCPDDPAKTAPGACGCGAVDADSDGDGVADCDDGCPTDPSKTEPGACGCGSADTDSDGDGVADCDDLCPNDPLKTDPGTCGCGVADGDRDGDGVLDCEDGCPDDPAKSDPGTCGCGVADADVDGDGVADCEDLCPNDPDKVAPGACGCGVPDVDSDGDAVPDCEDGCPEDPTKSDPGTCGCGVADTDSDGDGVADCDDLCPNDPLKSDPGTCGCGVADTDSDGDGVPDCDDGCPNDPDKLEPGVCGCGVSDVDSDGDGVADCDDPCPNDPLKTDPGTCGCGVADTDSDGDGVPDCDDGCPNDPDKLEPGVCGCGVADTDSDSDGVADCDDLCPNDPLKTDPGTCGCGVADTDSDGDGVPDCDDGCPNDPDKLEPGACGCGVSDADSDGDGVPDCFDQCPDTPAGAEVDEFGCVPLAVDAGDDVEREEVGPVTLSATVVGGTEPYTYAWAASGWEGADTANVVVMPTVTTVYTLTVTDSSEPQQVAVDSVTVTVNVAAGPQYTIAALALPGSTMTYPEAINNAGDIVGYYYDANSVRRAFLYRNGVVTQLGTLGGSEAMAHGLNDMGQVVGEAQLANGNWHGFLWTASGGMQDLGTLGGTYSVAYAINNAGHVVGYSAVDSSYHAFEWAFGVMATLGTTAYYQSAAFDINTPGQVVGTVLHTGDYTSTGFMYDNGTLHDLGAPLLAESQCWVINDHGLVAGYAWNASEERSFLYYNGVTVDIGALPDYPRTYAYGLNNLGQVVGGATDTWGFSAQAFVYTGGEMFDLAAGVTNSGDWSELSSAQDVNDSGQIVGYGVLNGVYQGFVLTPAP